MDKQNTIIILGFFSTIVVGIIIFMVFLSYFNFLKGYYAGYEEGEKAGQETTEVNPGKIMTNPLEKMPGLNPFEKIINPFRELYKNPFAQ